MAGALVQQAGEITKIIGYRIVVGNWDGKEWARGHRFGRLN